jgi:polar amino acid transport system substrate-binding protein
MTRRGAVLHASLTALLLLLAPGANGGALDSIASSKTLRIGYVDGQAPFASTAGGGEPAGYAVDLCRMVADKIRPSIPDLQVRYVAETLTTAFAGLEQGRIDLLCGAITETLGRRAAADFSLPIFLTGASALVRTDAPQAVRVALLGDRKLRTPRALLLNAFADRRVGVRANSTTEAQLEEIDRRLRLRATIVRVPDHVAGLRMLENREIDAYFGDRALLVGLLGQAQAPGALEISERLYTFEHYAIGLPPGDAELRLLVDRTLSEVYRSDDIKQLFVKHFGPTLAASATFASLGDVLKALGLPE